MHKVSDRLADREVRERSRHAVDTLAFTLTSTSVIAPAPRRVSPSAPSECQAPFRQWRRRAPLGVYRPAALLARTPCERNAASLCCTARKHRCVSCRSGMRIESTTANGVDEVGVGQLKLPRGLLPLGSACSTSAVARSLRRGSRPAACTCYSNVALDVETKDPGLWRRRARSGNAPRSGFTCNRAARPIVGSTFCR